MSPLKTQQSPTKQQRQGKQHAEHKAEKQFTQSLHANLHKHAKALAENINPEVFVQMCNDPDKKNINSLRLTRVKFKQFLNSKLGPNLSEKLNMVLDFN